MKSDQMLSKDIPILRVARPTNEIDKILKFYHNGLGFDLLFKFEGHEGFNGVMLGRKGAPYHFEFTQKEGHTVPNSPTQDNLIVFYMPNDKDFQDAVTRMKNCGFDPVPSFNPYWDRGGVTFEDHEGYRVVFYHGAWDY
jgi:catechol 2,3-dioxygenase-like lactoylglutathione lyase family enzyme